MRWRGLFTGKICRSYELGSYDRFSSWNMHYEKKDNNEPVSTIANKVSPHKFYMIPENKVYSYLLNAINRKYLIICV